MKRAIKWTGWAVLAALVVIQFVQPARTNPPSVAGASVFAQTKIPEDVRGVPRRACFDCHSNDTRWPWYSRVAPVSWVVVDDVNHGRKHVNFSEWQKLEPPKAGKRLEEGCDEVSQKGMPLRSYIWMHGDAELSDAERQRVCEWSRTERARLVGSIPPEAAKP